MKASRYNKVLGLAIGERSMQLAEVNASVDKPEARHLDEFEYPAGLTLAEPMELGARLAEFLRSKNYTAKQVVVGLPAKWLLVKTKEVPPADATLAADLLRLQAEGEFSSELRDLVFDYAGESDTSKSQNVLLVATQRKNVELAEQLCEAAKLTPIAVTSSAAVLGAVTSRGTNKNTVVLAMTAGGAELSAQTGGHPTSLRHLRAPGQTGQEGLFLSELRRAVSMLPVNGTSREMIVWDGADADSATFGQNLGLPVRFGELPTLGVRTPDVSRNGAGRKFGPAVALAVSALGTQRLPVDFMHSRLAPVPVKLVKPWMIWTGAASLLAILLGIWGYVSLQHAKNELAGLNVTYSKMEPRVKTATSYVDMVSFAERWEGDDPRYLACLADLTAVIPEDGNTYVTNLTIKEKEIRPDAIAKAAAAHKPPPSPGLIVTIVGNAPSQMRAQDLYNSLLKHPDWFTDVNPPKVQTGTSAMDRRGSSPEATFTLTCTFLMSPKPATTKPASVKPAASQPSPRRF